MIQKKKTLGHIYDTERPDRLNDHRHVGHCVHARVVVYMYLITVMTGQNISAICISPKFIESIGYNNRLLHDIPPILILFIEQLFSIFKQMLSIGLFGRRDWDKYQTFMRLLICF